ncbi:hypothetical protein [Parashewanella tropica]|uniref:hypothetical protein n=1 Tax=Parashewanella tropica TaxID=2547970 RepID=UPI00105999CC|nr:hypothetical protein [Parashewanella tropica]
MATALQNVINPSYRQTSSGGYEATKIKVDELKFLEHGRRDVTIKHPDQTYHQYTVKLGTARRGTFSTRIICKFFIKQGCEYTPTLESFSERYKVLLISIDQTATDAINNDKKLKVALIKSIKTTEPSKRPRIQIYRSRVNSRTPLTTRTNHDSPRIDTSSQSSDSEEEPDSVLYSQTSRFGPINSGHKRSHQNENSVRCINWNAVGRVFKKGTYYFGIAILGTVFFPCTLAYIAYQSGKNSF